MDLTDFGLSCTLFMNCHALNSEFKLKILKNYVKPREMIFHLFPAIVNNISESFVDLYTSFGRNF